MKDETKDKVITAGSPVNTPSEIIPGQQINPDAMPVAEPFKGDELAVFETSEVDISAMNVPEIETLQNTLGSLRPMQAYTPAADVVWMQQRNAVNGKSDLLSDVLQHDSDQLSVSMIQRGANLINPLGLPPLRQGDVSGGAVDVAKLTALYFSNNGPSIATPGTSKRAAVEQSMQSMRSQIINAFNRDIPFTVLSAAERALALKSYEAELLKIQLFFQAIDVLRGYANYLTKMNIPLSTEWELLFDTDAYIALTAMYNAIADLPIFDKQAHDRLEKLGRIYTSAKRQAVPGTCIFQDCMIAEDHYKEGVELTQSGQYAAHKVQLSQILPNLPISVIWEHVRSGNFVALVQYYNRRAQNIRRQYEMVITALAQMTSKQALATCPLSDYLPAQPNAFGAMDFASAEPVFSYAFHERMEYAPVSIIEESGSGGSSVTGIWTLMKLPDSTSSMPPSQTMMLRPVGKSHGKQAWKVAELIDIGLFRQQSASSISADGTYMARIAGSTLTVSGGVVTCAESAIYNVSDVVFDAVYGDFYLPGSLYQYLGQVGMNDRTIRFHGMSFFASGSGLHNTLGIPGGIIGGTYSAFTVGISGGVMEGFGYIDGMDNSYDWEDVLPGIYFIEQLATAAGFVHMIVFKANAVGERECSYAIMRGYKDTGYYSMSIAAVDNAVAKEYNSMVPFVEYTPRRK